MLPDLRVSKAKRAKHFRCEVGNLDVTGQIGSPPWLPFGDSCHLPGRVRDGKEEATREEGRSSDDELSEVSIQFPVSYF